VIIAGGSGPDALIAPEMEAFGELFGLAFMAHAIGHSDRKGRIERPFSYVENNFLAGRTFADWADLNVQARAWCRGVANAKPKRVLGMSPQAAYAMEKAHLLPLPAYIPPVTEIHYRVVDCYGFVHLDTLCGVREYVERIVAGADANSISGSVYSTYSSITTQGGDQLVRCSELSASERQRQGRLYGIKLFCGIGS
jgi:hypothetical protein